MDPTPGSVSFEKKLSATLQIGISTSASSSSITPLIRVLDQCGNPLFNVTVELEIVDLVTQTLTSSPTCDKTYREAITGTLEYIRLAEVCRVTLSNSTNKTDKLGQGSFNDFLIES